MANKVLDADYIKSLFAGDKKKLPKPENIAKTAQAVFADTLKPDPLLRPQAGYEQKGEKGDIWAQWIKQHRMGATDLVERWGLNG